MFEKLKTGLKHFLSDESGATVTEYGIVIGLMALAGTLVILSPIGTNIQKTLQNFESELASALGS